MTNRVIAVLLLAAVLAGVGVMFVESEARGQLAVACDNKCRERLFVRPCTGNQACTSFDPPTCLFCSTNANHLCKPHIGDTKAGGTCIPREKLAIVTYYKSCTDVCSCGGNALAIEIEDPREATGGVSIDQYYCD